MFQRFFSTLRAKAIVSGCALCTILLWGIGSPLKWTYGLTSPAEVRSGIAPSISKQDLQGSRVLEDHGHKVRSQTYPIAEGSVPMATSNAFRSGTSSCQSTLWAPGSADCKGQPTLPASLSPLEAKKHQSRLKDDRVVRLHKDKCAYEGTRTPLLTEIAIVLLPYLLHAGTDVLQNRLDMVVAAYQSQFSHLVIIGTGLNLTVSEQGDVIIWPCDASVDTHTFAYVCVAKLLDWMVQQRHADKSQGFSFFHTDFWLHPSHLASLLAEDSKMIISVTQSGWERVGTSKSGVPTPWRIPEGFPNFKGYPRFTNHTCVDEKDFWKSFLHRGLSQRGTIRSSGTLERGYIHDPDNMMWNTFHEIDDRLFPKSSSDRGQVCYGWSDLFRLPRELWDKFIEYALMFGSLHDARDKNLEVVIPTLLRKLAATSGRTVRMMDCWGGTVAKTFKKIHMELYPCGHRMELKDANVRADFVEAVRCG